MGSTGRITRTRAPREWREEWNYDARAAAGPRQLHFVNGKLAAVEAGLVEAPRFARKPRFQLIRILKQARGAGRAPVQGK